MSKCIFPYYSGNIEWAKVLGHITYDKFVKLHKLPTVKNEKLFSEINAASKVGDKKLKAELKYKLYAFTPSVYVKTGERRRYANIKHFTGVMQLDFDGIDTLEEAIEIKKHIFKHHKQILCSYLSPSGLGVKCLLKTTVPEDIEHYRAIYKAVEEEFVSYSYFDPATKNAILPLFLSMDTSILFRDFDKCAVWTKEDWSKEKYVVLNEVQPVNYATERNFNHARVVDIISRRINDIVSDGHPQVRNTSLVLGSRVGAGYIEHFDAEQLIESLICSNTYLQKGIDGYVKTAKWAIRQGMKQAKYF